MKKDLFIQKENCVNYSSLKVKYVVAISYNCPQLLPFVHQEYSVT